MELETQIQIALRLNFVSADKASSLLEQASEIGKMLNGLKQSLSAHEE